MVLSMDPCPPELLPYYSLKQPMDTLSGLSCPLSPLAYGPLLGLS